MLKSIFTYVGKSVFSQFLIRTSAFSEKNRSSRDRGVP